MNVYDALTAAELTSTNLTVPAGDIWIERDTGYAKRGRGIAWTSTPYWDAGGGHRYAGVAPNLIGPAGDYWSYPTTHTATALTSGALYTHPVYVPNDVVIDRIGAEVTVGAGSSTLTLGAYRDDGFGNPGALLFDAGTIDGNSATAQEITVSRKLPGLTLYHFAALCAGGTPTVRLTAGSAGWSGRQATLAAAVGGGSVRVGRLQTGIAGTSLPTTAVTTTSPSSVVLVAVRLA